MWAIARCSNPERLQVGMMMERSGTSCSSAGWGIRQQKLSDLGVDGRYRNDRGKMPMSLGDRMLGRIKRAVLVKWVYPFLDQYLLQRYKVWGDRSRLELANNALVANALFNLASGKVTVGQWAFFGHNVCVLTGSHDYRKLGPERQLAVPTNGGDIVIGEGAWVGSNVTLLGPCTIGEHAVIAAGSLVRGEVAAY